MPILGSIVLSRLLIHDLSSSSGRKTVPQQLPKGTKIVVRLPETIRGKVGYIDGEPFKFPGQNFWVCPVVVEGTAYLATSYEEFIPPKKDKPKLRSLDDPWAGV